MVNLKEVIRYEMVTNGDRVMLPKPDGGYVKFSDIKEAVEQSTPSTNTAMLEIALCLQELSIQVFPMDCKKLGDAKDRINAVVARLQQ